MHSLNMWYGMTWLAPPPIPDLLPTRSCILWLLIIDYGQTLFLHLMDMQKKCELNWDYLASCSQQGRSSDAKRDEGNWH
jgi:hypothetical protein